MFLVTYNYIIIYFQVSIIFNSILPLFYYHILQYHHITALKTIPVIPIIAEYYIFIFPEY